MESFGPESMDLRDPLNQPDPAVNSDSDEELMDGPSPGPIILLSPKNTDNPDLELNIIEDLQLNIDKLTNFGTCELNLYQDTENPFIIN